MRILVTGSSSFIGAILCPMLAERHIITVYDAKHGNDICDENSIKSVIESSDVIIHLAACSTPKLCEENPELAQRVNVDAVDMINRLRGSKPLFYPNTNIGYGAQIKQDIYDENSPMHPNSVYGKTKCEGERLILEHGHCVVFRLASLFGCSPSMRWNLLLNFMVKEAFEKGKLEIYEGHVRRNFLHVKDMCRAFIYAIDNYDKMKNQVYNVGLKYHPTKAELVRKVIEQLPETKFATADGGDPDKRDYVISNEKIYAAGWQPTLTIEDGIKELIGVLRG